MKSFDEQTQSAIKISLEEEKLRETHQRNEFLRIQDDFQNQEKQNNQNLSSNISPRISPGFDPQFDPQFEELATPKSAPGDSKREMGPSIPMRPPVN